MTDHGSASGGIALQGRGGGGGGARGASIGGVTESRVAAAAACADLRAGELLDVAFDARASELDPRDRRWLRELLYGMLRHRGWLDAVLGERVRGGYARLDADLLDLLRLGAYQLLFMSTVPAYAAIAQTVELAKRRHGIGASKLVNAVLRRVDREREGLAPRVPNDNVGALAVTHSHPQWLVARWIERFGVADTTRLLVANNREAPLVARPYHAVREQVEAMLEAADVHVDDAPLVRDSLVIAGSVTSFTELGPFRQGLFHLQDPASTLVTMYAHVDAGSTVADLCAAPGGKSIELSRRAGVVLASDLSPQRMRRVAQNRDRLEVQHMHAYVADARQPAIRPVDVVTIDVPCTGTGTYRRHPDARWRIRPSDFAVLGALQKQILNAAATVVKPGGLLVYSTCSLEPEENEEQVNAFLASHTEFVLEPPPEGVVPDDVLDGGFLRVLPHRHGTDGSFAARLRRVRA